MLLAFRLLPERASTVAGQVDLLYYFLIGISIFFATLIFGLVAFFAVKYRRREGRKSSGGHENLKLELLWTVIPLGLAMVLFFWGAEVFTTLTKTPDTSLDITGVGKQWMWKFQHPTGQSEINTLHVPAGRKVKVTLTSEDVIHSFYVPAFRVKTDVVPGRYTSAWFEATKPGKYRLFCAEYCGTKHSEMGGFVYVMDPIDYQKWLGGGESASTPAQAGEKLFAQFGCNTCHREDDLARGPSLTGLYGESVSLATGQVVSANDMYLRESILRPNAKVVEGYQRIMPTFQGLITEEGVLQLIAYIKTLSKEEDQESSL
jgi:cytochrome c oxidase subunit 2